MLEVIVVRAVARTQAPCTLKDQMDQNIDLPSPPDVKDFPGKT